MLVHFDESGDYGFPEDRFDCYVQAALICPDSRLSQVEHFVAERQADWGVEELHASSLTTDQLLQVCRFIEGSPCQLLASVTDTVMTTPAQIAEFRLSQAARLKENLDTYHSRGGNVKEIEDWMLRNIKRAGLATQVTHGEFLQAYFMLELIAEAFRKSLINFLDDMWRQDFHEFNFILDAKLPAKMAAGEKFLNDVIVPTLGSRPGTSIITVDTWRRAPIHPFHAKYSVSDGRVAGRDVGDAIDLKLVFEHGLQFEPSHERAGLQLADAVAYTVRRAVLDPDHRTVQRAYDAIRPKLRNGRGESLTIMRLNTGAEDRSSLERYRPLFGPTRLF